MFLRMSNYVIDACVTVRYMAEEWRVTTRTVQTMSAEGRIEGATKFGDVWAIPKNARKPMDNRVRTGAYKDWRRNIQKI